MARIVGQVIVLAGVMVAATVKQDVDSIFRSVDDFMSGRTNKILPATVGGRQKVQAVQRVADDREVAASAAFPVGVVLSDNLYPLVVGKNMNTGKPFVINLDQQHALVVARGGSENFRMLIPFPVVVGNHFSPAKKDFGSATAEYAYQKRNPISHIQGEHYSQNPPKVSKIYPRPYSVRHGTELPHYKTSQRPIAPPYYEGVVSPPVENYHSKGKSRNSVRYDNLKPQQITYYVEGPQYPIPLPKPRYVYSRDYPRNVKDDNSDRHQTKTSVPIRDRPQEERSVVYDEVPEDFRPSPYLGNITEDNDVVGLQPQSEIVQSYDDDDAEFTEQDYMDSIKDSPESHSSTGEVRHVTYHADDYLGKIYEDMYYKLPQDVESRSKEHMATEHHVSKQEQEPQEDSSQYKAESTFRHNKAETSNPKRGPVTFDVPEQQIDSTNR